MSHEKLVSRKQLREKHNDYMIMKKIGGDVMMH